MKKLMPYHQYDVLAIESLLNDTAAKGYKLTKFGASFCEFEKNEGNPIYYRVRYIDGNTNIGDTFWWGDLYVYHSEDRNALPPPNYNEDAAICASKQGKPHLLLINILAIIYVISHLLPNFEMAPPALIAVCIIAVLLWSASLIEDIIEWARAFRLATGKITVTESPAPPPYLRNICRILQMGVGVCVLIFIFIVNL